MVWGGISARGLTKLHVVPNKTSITAEYYHGVISKCSLVKNQGGNPDKFGSVYARPKQVSNQSEKTLFFENDEINVFFSNVCEVLFTESRLLRHPCTYIAGKISLIILLS